MKPLKAFARITSHHESHLVKRLHSNLREQAAVLFPFISKTESPIELTIIKSRRNSRRRTKHLEITFEYSPLTFTAFAPVNRVFMMLEISEWFLVLRWKSVLLPERYNVFSFQLYELMLSIVILVLKVMSATEARTCLQHQRNESSILSVLIIHYMNRQGPLKVSEGCA